MKPAQNDWEAFTLSMVQSRSKSLPEYEGTFGVCPLCPSDTGSKTKKSAKAVLTAFTSPPNAARWNAMHNLAQELGLVRLCLTVGTDFSLFVRHVMSFRPLVCGSSKQQQIPIRIFDDESFGAPRLLF